MHARAVSQHARRAARGSLDMGRRLSSDSAGIKATFGQSVMPTYGRFDIVLSHGLKSSVWAVDGTRYLDMGGGIAVNSLGHAHPEIVEAVREQSAKLMHVSNLYYTDVQGRLAHELCALFGTADIDGGDGGKVFFCNSGAEANEGLIKLARRTGQDPGGDPAKHRHEIITMNDSFHGRTLACIAATGQDKIKAGFFPMVDGFKHVPFGDVDAVRGAIGERTTAVMLEGIQGEGGIQPASAEYLLALRALCDEHGLLLLMDGVQCGHFRTGRFQSYQRILEDVEEDSKLQAAAFAPDAMSMAKSIAAGFPMGAIWARQAHADTLHAGAHGTTYGGNALGCAVALKVLEIIERDGLEQNARATGEYLRTELQALCDRFPGVLEGVRGTGLMMGVVLRNKADIPAFAAQDGAAAGQLVQRFHEAGMLTVPSGEQVVRLLPALNVSAEEVEECLDVFRSVVADIAAARS